MCIGATRLGHWSTPRPLRAGIGASLSLAALATLLPAVLTPAAVHAWPMDPGVNVPICAASEDQRTSRMAADGGLWLAGGAAPRVWLPPITGIGGSALGGAIIYAHLPQAGGTLLTIHDVLGSHVRTLTNAHLDAGDHRVQWDLRDGRGELVARGTYYIQLRSEGGRAVAKTVVLR